MATGTPRITVLAIVIRDPRAYGERFSELAYEHRRHAVVRFFEDHAQVLQWLDGKSRDERRENE